MDEARFDRLQHDTQHLIALSTMPAWEIARRVFRERQQKEMKDFFKNISMTPDDIAYRRGFGAALEYVIGTVDNAEEAFARHIANRAKEAEKVG